MTTQPPPALSTSVVAVTPGQAKAAFKARRQERAAAAGKPLKRTQQPGLYAAASVGVYVFCRGRELRRALLTTEPGRASGSTEYEGHRISLPAFRGSEKVTFSMLVDMVRNAYAASYDGGSISAFDAIAPAHNGPATVLVADRRTLMMMLSLAVDGASAPGASAEERQIERMLRYRRGLPTSAFMPILTESLATRFWSPADTDETSVDAWAEAFGWGGSGDVVKVPRLMVAAMHGPSNPKYLKSLLAAEKFGTSSAAYSSITNTTRAFRQSNSFSAAHGAILNTDTLLAPFNALTGEVVSMGVDKVTGGSFHAKVRGLFKIKAPSPVIIFDEATPVGGTLRARLLSLDLTSGDDALTATFTVPKEDERGVITAAAANPEHKIYVLASPYMSPPPKGDILGTWADDGTETDRHHRRDDLPIDVILAGGPVED